MKKFLSVFITIFIIAGMFTMVPLTSSAATKTWNVSATSSDNVTATLDTETGTMTISGTGNMKDYTAYRTNLGGVYSDSPFASSTQIKKIIVESGITRIGEGAFCHCKNLNYIIINNIQRITLNGYAFYNCTALKTICVEGSVYFSQAIEIGSGLMSVIPNSSNLTIYHPYQYDYSKVKETYPNVSMKNHEEYTNNDWTITEVPTQTENGIASATCSITNEHNVKYKLPALSDTDFWTSNITAEPTCSETGIMTYTSEVGEVTEAIPINPNKHNWDAWDVIINPTDSKIGLAEHICLNNSEHSVLKKLPALTDSKFWTKGEYIAPTTTTEGSQEYISEYGTFTETIPKLTPTPTSTIEPTATPTVSPSASPSPSAPPSTTPTATPTISPSIEPSAAPTASPDTEPTDTPSPTVSPSTKPTIPPDIDINTNCIKIIATYSTDGILESVSVEEIKISEIILSQNTKTNKVFYWESLESMKPLEWLCNLN